VQGFLNDSELEKNSGRIRPSKIVEEQYKGSCD
jgi:hypothetical protein